MAGQAVYTKEALRAYDFVVHGISRSGRVRSTVFCSRVKHNQNVQWTDCPQPLSRAILR